MEYVVILLFVVACVSGCRDFSHKPWVRQTTGEGTEGMKIHYSDRVLFATVTELIPDPVHKKDGVQAAKVDIVCIYKGGQLPKQITIIGAGKEMLTIVTTYMSHNMTKPTKLLCAQRTRISYPFSAQRRLWSDWADFQADLSLRWAHTQFVGFVMSRLISAFMELWQTLLRPNSLKSL